MPDTVVHGPLLGILTLRIENRGKPPIAVRLGKLVFSENLSLKFDFDKIEIIGPVRNR